MKLKDVIISNIKDLQSFKETKTSYLGSRGISWSSYWSHQSEVLFFGLYSEISGGQMPNKVTGATDFLTVAGVAGSETYQAPNTAAYIAADTDYIWFKRSTTQRTTTTAELIGYDFGRTIIYYDSASPNSIVAIMILSSALSVDKMNRCRTEFKLSVWWDGTLNVLGEVKSNRGAYRRDWDYMYVLNSAITKGLFYMNESSTVTKSGGRVSAISGFNGIGSGLSQADAAKYLYWDAGENVPYTNAYGNVRLDHLGWTLSQPFTLYFLVKPDFWVNSHRMISNSGSACYLYYFSSSPKIQFRAAGYDSPLTDLPIGAYALVTITSQVGQSSIQINNGAEGNWNMANLGAVGNFRLGGDAAANNSPSAHYKALAIRSQVDSAEIRTDIYNCWKERFEF